MKNTAQKNQISLHEGLAAVVAGSKESSTNHLFTKSLKTPFIQGAASDDTPCLPNPTGSRVHSFDSPY